MTADQGGTPGWREELAAFLATYEDDEWPETIGDRDPLVRVPLRVAVLRAALAAAQDGGGFAAPRNWSHSLNDGAMVVDPPPAVPGAVCMVVGEATRATAGAGAAAVRAEAEPSPGYVCGKPLPCPDHPNSGRHAQQFSVSPPPAVPGGGGTDREALVNIAAKAHDDDCPQRDTCCFTTDDARSVVAVVLGAVGLTGGGA